MNKQTIIVPSVKHSGADILTKHILAAYEPATFKDPASGDVVSDHVLYTKIHALIALAESGNPCIVPIRHPRLCAMLWQQNGDELSPDFFQMWNSIQLFTEVPSVHFLPMDADDLTTRIKVIAEETGLRLSTSLGLSEEESRILALRPWNFEYDEIRDHGDRVQDLVDDSEEFLVSIYGEQDPEQEPSKEEKAAKRKKKAREKRAPKNMWKHPCPAKEEEIFTKKGEICVHCGAEE